MNLRLCYIPYIWKDSDTKTTFATRLIDKESCYGVITVNDDERSAGFLAFLATNGLDKGLVYQSTEAVSYRYPDKGPRLTLRVYSFKGMI